MAFLSERIEVAEVRVRGPPSDLLDESGRDALLGELGGPTRTEGKAGRARAVHPDLIEQPCSEREMRNSYSPKLTLGETDET